MAEAGWSEEQMEALRRSVRELGSFHDTQGSRLPLQTIVSRLGPGKSTFNVSGTLAKPGDLLSKSFCIC